MLQDKKITQEQINTRNVKSAPNRLKGTATENKNIFDRLIEFLINKFNELVDELSEINANIHQRFILTEAKTVGLESSINDLKNDCENGEYGGLEIIKQGEIIEPEDRKEKVIYLKVVDDVGDINSATSKFHIKVIE